MSIRVLVIDVDCTTMGVSSMVNSIAIDVNSVAIDVDSLADDVVVVNSVIVDNTVAGSVAIDDVTGGADSVVVDIKFMAIDDDSVTRGADFMTVDIDPVAVGATSGEGSKGVENSGVAVMGISSNTLKLCCHRVSEYDSIE